MRRRRGGGELPKAADGRIRRSGGGGGLLLLLLWRLWHLKVNVLYVQLDLVLAVAGVVAVLALERLLNRVDLEKKTRLVRPGETATEI